jgi:hypothetical protein
LIDDPISNKTNKAMEATPLRSVPHLGRSVKMKTFFQRRSEERMLKKLAASLGPTLKKRYGFQEYYSEGQVLKTIEDCEFDPQTKPYAVAMFVFPNKLMEYCKNWEAPKLQQSFASL